MAEREIRIPIVGDSSQLKRELDKAERELGGFGGNAKKLAQDFNKEFLLVGAGIAAGLGIAVKSAMDFDKQISEVGAVSGATGKDLDALRESAIKAGAATVFSAKEAAQAQTELAKAGVSTSDILGGGLTGALNLASAGNLDLATAAEYAANAMTTFGLAGSDVPRIADALAAGANKSAADVDDMGLALQQAGLVADQTGLSLEETVGTLSLFAQAGLKGSDAGTSLKTALLKLNPQSKEAAALMDDLGLKFYDANGQFVGITVAAQQLKDKLGPLSDEQRNMALSTIFGTDAIRAATVLMDAGSGGVQSWTNAVSDSGYAADLAAKKTDNLAGDLEQLRGSLETALIQGGSQATDVLRALTQTLTTTVNGIGDMPAPLQTAFLGLTGLVGVGSTAVGVYGTLAPKIEKFKETLSAMGGIGSTVAANLGAISIAAGGLTAALGAVAFFYGQNAAEQAKFQAGVDKLVSALKDGGAASEEFDKALRQAFVDSGIGDILANTDADLTVLTTGLRNSGTELDKWGESARGSLGEYQTMIREAADAGDPFAQELQRLASTGQLTGKQYEALVRGLDMLNDQTDTAAEKMGVENTIVGNLADGTGDAAGQTSKFADEQLQAAQNAEATAKALEKQYTAITQLAGGDIAYRQSQIATKEALAEYDATMKDGTKSALERDAAGQDLLQTFLREADANVQLAQEMQEAVGGQLSAADAAQIQKGKLEELRDTLAPGNPLRQQLQGYIDKLGEVPPDLITNVKLKTADALLALSDLQYRITALDGRTVTVTAQVNARTSIYNDDGSYNLDNNPKTPAAMGTSFVSPNYPRLVGERGPELFWPANYGSITSASQTGNLLAGGGGGGVTKIAELHLHGVENFDDFVEKFRRWERSNGAVSQR